MPRSYWCIVIAALGCLGNAPQGGTNTQEAKAEPNQTEAARTAPTNSESLEPVQPLEYYRPCRDDQKNGNSDLCAQWTAAQGAADAAFWAKLSFWAGLAGIGGLLWTLYYTRKAVLVAERGAKEAEAGLQIARDGNAISQELGVAQTRAYLSIRAEGTAPWNDADGLSATFLVTNSGQSPARKVHIDIQAQILNRGQIQKAEDNLLRLGDIAAGAGPIKATFRWKELSRADLAMFADQVHQLQWIVKATYDTIFDNVKGEDNFGFHTFVGTDPARFERLTVTDTGMARIKVRLGG